jgi:hypothetical protein
MRNPAEAGLPIKSDEIRPVQLSSSSPLSMLLNPKSRMSSPALFSKLFSQWPDLQMPDSLYSSFWARAST